MGRWLQVPLAVALVLTVHFPVACQALSKSTAVEEASSGSGPVPSPVPSPEPSSGSEEQGSGSGPSAPPPPKSDEELSAGAVVAIVGATVAGLALIGFVAAGATGYSSTAANALAFLNFKSSADPGAVTKAVVAPITAPLAMLKVNMYDSVKAYNSR